MTLEQLANNLALVRRRISIACESSGRSDREVQLVAVTKYSSVDEIRMLLSCGHRVLGESRPQQLASRAEELNGENIEWHAIGHIQRNKVRQILPYVTLIHSVDSLRLLEEIDRTANNLDLHPAVLLQVNISGEESKQGFSPQELRDAVAQLKEFQHVEIKGLMTMAPLIDNDDEIRPIFGSLRSLLNELKQEIPTMTELSMGMSNDFEVALQEGATFIRLGSVLFKG